MAVKRNSNNKDPIGTTPALPRDQTATDSITTIDVPSTDADAPPETVIPESVTVKADLDDNVKPDAVLPSAPVLNKADWLPKREPSLARLHRWLKIIEPWGIALALVAFAIDYNGRVEERTRGAWELLALSGPGNSGKIDALEYLHSEGLFKRRQPLTGIDLASEDGKARTYLDGISLPNAYLKDANLSGADLQWADLSEANLWEADLSEANLFEADLSGALLQGADLSGARVGQANMSEANLVEADLSEANLGKADLSGAELKWADLSEANLVEADLSEANLRDANLSGVDLRYADLSGVRLRGVDLSAADLLRAKKLTQKQLNESCGNDNTRLPEGLKIAMCSEVDWYERIHGNTRTGGDDK